MATFKRKTFYLSGFDPRGARFYHQFYREQARAYAARWDEPISVSPRRKAGEMAVGWRIENPAQDVVNEVTFLRWDDIVGQAWITHPVRLMARSLMSYAAYIRRIDWPMTLKLPRTPLIALFYPFVAAVVLPIVLLALVWGGLAFVLPWWAALLVALAVAVAVTVPVAIHVRAPWLLRLFIFNDAICDGSGIPGLDDRLALFARTIAPALDEPWDEVLLVTHSNGAILAIPVMERLLADRGGQMPDNFVLLTLGHCIPLVACRGDAKQFHAQLRALAAAQFRWVDIGFPPDGASYCGVDPLALRAKETRADMTLLSPRWFRFHSPAAYKALLASKYELHFEYLRSAEQRSPIDFVNLTASRRPIAQAVAEFRAIA